MDGQSVFGGKLSIQNKIIEYYSNEFWIEYFMYTKVANLIFFDLSRAQKKELVKNNYFFARVFVISN